jgi:hypothetical protein
MTAEQYIAEIEKCFGDDDYIGVMRAWNDICVSTRGNPGIMFPVLRKVNETCGFAVLGVLEAMNDREGVSKHNPDSLALLKTWLDTDGGNENR